MKVFLRTFNPGINSKSGAALPTGQLRSGAERWARFEGILQRSLSELGCSLVLQPENPTIPDAPRDSDRAIYAHKTRRDLQGDLFYMQTHLADLFTLDTHGWGADHSSVPRREDWTDLDADACARFVAELREGMLRSGASKHAQPALGSRLGRWVRQRSFPQRWILVPLQTPRDYVALHHAEIDMLGFIDLIARAAAELDVAFAFKLHPYNTKDRDIHAAVDRAVDGDRRLLQVEGNIHELLAACSGVWTVNSGVGFEALVHEKPVVTFGDCDYRSAVFAADPERTSAALDYTFAEDPERTLAARRLVTHYCQRHGYLLDDPGAPARIGAYLAAWLEASNTTRE